MSEDKGADLSDESNHLFDLVRGILVIHLACRIRGGCGTLMTSQQTATILQSFLFALVSF